MNFDLNDEQRQLADSVTRFLNERYDFEARKHIIRSDSGMSDAVWQQLAELGILSLPFSEAAGGFGGGTAFFCEANADHMDHDSLGSLDGVAREIVKAPDVIDYTQRENVAERLVKRFGAAVGEGSVRALRNSTGLR